MVSVSYLKLILIAYLIIVKTKKGISVDIEGDITGGNNVQIEISGEMFYCMFAHFFTK